MVTLNTTYIFIPIPWKTILLLFLDSFELKNRPTDQKNSTILVLREHKTSVLYWKTPYVNCMLRMMLFNMEGSEHMAEQREMIMRKVYVFACMH